MPAADSESFIQVGPGVGSYHTPRTEAAGKYLIIRDEDGKEVFVAEFAYQYFRAEDGTTYYCYVPVFPGAELKDKVPNG